MRSKSQSNETAAPQQKKGKAGKVILTIVAILLGLAVGVGGFVYWYAKRLIVDHVTFVTNAAPTIVDEEYNKVELEAVIQTTY